VNVDEGRLTVTLSRRTIEAALNCLDACASDEREPDRYRDWYANAAVEIRVLTGEA